MDFGLTAEQKMLKHSAREFFFKEVNSALVRALEQDDKGYSPKIWTKMSRLGWIGLLVPEKYGGEGLDLLNMALVLEEMGQTALPGPFFVSAVVSAFILLEAASEPQKQCFLPELASGNKIFTAAWHETNTAISAADVSATAVRHGDCYTLNGTKSFVPYANVADYIIVAARTAEQNDSSEGISLFLLDRRAPGCTVTAIDTTCGETECELELDQVHIPSESLLGKVNEGWVILQRVFPKCAVAKCAEMIGGGAKVLDMTVAYAKIREQFGRPIGSFQAVQHHCANMKTCLDTSVLMTYQACSAISDDKPWEKQAAMCKAWVNESLRKLAALGHQVMGGFGFMEEADHQLYTRRMRTAETMFGNATYYRELVAQSMGL